MTDYNRFYELGENGELILVKEEIVSLPDIIKEKEEQLLAIYEELKALKGE